MPLQELNINALWMGGQTAKGTPAPLADFIHRFRVPPGGGWLTINRDDAEQGVSDLGKFGSASDWVNSLSGAGAPAVECTPEELAWLFWAFEGGEATTAITGPPAKTKHTFTPLPGIGKWMSALGRVGSSQIRRELFADGLLSQLVVEGSTANKPLRATPSLLFLDPAATQATDPAQALPTKRPFLHSDGQSRFTIDGTVFRGHSQFTLTLNLDLQPVYGDGSRIYDLALGNAGITLGCTVYLDAEGIPQYNKIVYGAAAPAPGAKPLDRLPALGSYSFDLQALDNAGVFNGDEFKLTLAGVKWNVPDRPAPNPDGGTAELALTGTMRPVAGQPAYQVDISCDAAAFTK